MDRTKLSYALFISLLLLLGVIAGLWFSGFWTKKPVPQPTTPVKPHVSSSPFKKPGWCCQKPPSKCIAEPGGAASCFKAGGKLFNDSQKLCDTVCSKLKK